MKKSLFIFNFILVSVIAVLNHYANELFWYWRFRWFDIPMHFLGGLWVGLMALWIYYLSGFFKDTTKTKKVIFLTSFYSVFIIAVGWEIFEFIIDVNYSDGYIPNTIQDLIMGLLGSATASTVYLKVVGNLERKEILEKVG